MQVSVDISLYPLHQDYIPQIDAFIFLLNQEPAVQVVTNALSTQLYGEYETVMELLAKAMGDHMAIHDDSVFTIKVLSGDRSHQNG